MSVNSAFEEGVNSNAKFPLRKAGIARGRPTGGAQKLLAFPYSACS